MTGAALRVHACRYDHSDHLVVYRGDRKLYQQPVFALCVPGESDHVLEP